jgi:hypothetical protein
LPALEIALPEKMKRKAKFFAYPGVIMILVLAWAFWPTSQNLDISEWTKVVVADTENVPLQIRADLVGKVSLESAAAGRKYDNMPGIERTTNLVGDFSKVGDSRIVHFSSGDTLVETIIAQRPPYEFGYEITKPSLPMKWAVYRARGYFESSAPDATHTITRWTYYFQQRNRISEFFVNRYINSTHRPWMNDMLTTTRNQILKAYNDSLRSKHQQL